MQKIVVLGAAGFVGRRVIERLVAADGIQPAGLARRPAPAWAAGATWQVGDATDAATVQAALAGADAAINCVAGDAASLVGSTRALCAAARAAGVRRIVHLSSMAVYGAATGLVGEDHPPDPGGWWYGQAKLESETLVSAFVRQGGDAVILRPGCVHGPRSVQWTWRVARLLRAHRIGDLGPAGDGGCNLVHVADVAEAVLAALHRPGIAGQVFNLGDPDPGTWNNYFVSFGRAIGATPIRRVSARWLAIEGKLLSVPLKVAEIAAGKVGLSRLAPEPLPRSLLRLWRQDIRLDHRRADAGLGFPRMAPEAALADAAAWVRAQATA